MGVTTVRLKDEEIKELKDFSKKLGSDQSTVLKQALKKGLKEMRFDFALENYSEHRISLSVAARLAGQSVWEFLDSLKKKGLFLQTDEENLEKTLKEFQ
ncbi:MAG: UPF0175 family protein [archaeon]|nr:UPF0175 family protein [archaeon]